MQPAAGYNVSLVHEVGQVGALSHCRGAPSRCHTDHETPISYPVVSGVANNIAELRFFLEATDLLWLYFILVFKLQFTILSRNTLPEIWAPEADLLSLIQSVQMHFICCHDSLLVAVFISHKAG